MTSSRAPFFLSFFLTSVIFGEMCIIESNCERYSYIGRYQLEKCLVNYFSVFSYISGVGRRNIVLTNLVIQCTLKPFGVSTVLTKKKIQYKLIHEGMNFLKNFWKCKLTTNIFHLCEIFTQIIFLLALSLVISNNFLNNFIFYLILLTVSTVGTWNLVILL